VAALEDVSPVSFPAYANTSIAMRSLLSHPEILSGDESRCYGDAMRSQDLHGASSTALDRCRSAHDAIGRLHDAMDEVDHAPNERELRALRMIRDHVPVLMRSCRDCVKRMDQKIGDSETPTDSPDETDGQDGEASGWLPNGSQTGDPGDGMTEDDKGQNSTRMRELQRIQQRAEAGDDVSVELRSIA
jgi:hypothetical protein